MQPDPPAKDTVAEEREYGRALELAIARQRTFYAPAGFVFILYILFWLPGAAANWYFYNEAKRHEAAYHVIPPGKDLLWLLLVILFWVPLIFVFPILSLAMISEAQQSAREETQRRVNAAIERESSTSGDDIRSGPTLSEVYYSLPSGGASYPLPSPTPVQLRQFLLSDLVELARGATTLDAIKQRHGTLDGGEIIRRIEPICPTGRSVAGSTVTVEYTVGPPETENAHLYLHFRNRALYKAELTRIPQ